MEREGTARVGWPKPGAGWATPPVRPHPAIKRQWLCAIAVGLGLGLAGLGVMLLPPPWSLVLAAAAMSPFVAMIVGDVRRLLLGVILLDIPMNLDTFFGWRADVAARGAIGGWNVSVTTLALIGLYALWFGAWLTGRGARPRLGSAVSIALMLYLACTIVSVAVARDATLAGFQLVLYAQLFLIYLYVASTIRTKHEVLFVVSVLLVGLVAESLFMIAVFVVGHEIPIGTQTPQIDLDPAVNFPRMNGTIGSPNAAAAYISLLLAPAAGLLLASARWSQRWLAVAALGLGGIALALTFSRGGWIATAISLGLFCLLAARRGWLPMKIPVITACLIVLLAAVFRDVIGERLFGNDDLGAAYARVPLMTMAWRMISDHPLLGVGANNYAYMIPEYATPETFGEWLYTVHNRYLLIWAETGPAALLAYLTFLGAAVVRGWQAWRRDDRLTSLVALGLTTALVGHITQGFNDIFNSRPLLQLLWLLIGLIVALSTLSQALESSGRGSVPAKVA